MNNKDIRMRMYYLKDDKVIDITFESFVHLKIFKDSKQGKEIWNKFKEVLYKNPTKYFDSLYHGEQINGIIFIGGYNLGEEKIKEIIEFEQLKGKYHFEWDFKKDIKGQNKHGVSFEEAVSVFEDRFAVYCEDEDHSTLDEQRFLLIGISKKTRLLVVVYCERQKGNVIRIITAFPGSNKHKQYYNEENNHGKL